MFKIPGFLDDHLREYVDWLISRHSDPGIYAGLQAAYEAARNEYVSLMEISIEKDIEFFLGQGILRGIAWLFINGIEHWLRRVKNTTEGAI